MSCHFDELSNGEVIAISAAIVQLAIEDYSRLKAFKYPKRVGGRHNFNWRTRIKMMAEIEAFLRSPWCDTLSMGNSETILRHLESYASS